MLQPLLPYTPERDVYRLLGVPANASSDEITAACRRLAVMFHPDHNRSSRANAQMQVVNHVRRVLSDPNARALYDRERLRFHAVVARPAVPPAPVSWEPPPRRDPPSTFERYVRAALIGMRITLASLAPTRCRRCRIVIAAEDAYCAACGTPLLTGG